MILRPESPQKHFSSLLSPADEKPPQPKVKRHPDVCMVFFKQNFSRNFLQRNSTNIYRETSRQIAVFQTPDSPNSNRANSTREMVSRTENTPRYRWGAR